MPYKRHQLDNHKIKLSTIVERLPMYRFLDESRAAVLKLQTNWQRWLKQAQPNLDDSAACITSYEVKSQTVTISTDNASTASLIKHQQQSLLNALNENNGADVPVIAKLKVRVDLQSTKTAAELHDTMSQPNNQGCSYNLPDENAIRSVQQLQTSIKNPDLADTLGQLAETLKTLSNGPDKNST